MRLRCAWLIPLFLTGCAPVGHQASRAARPAGPSAQELHEAMADGIYAGDGEGGIGSVICPYVRRHQCSRINRDRFHCTYVDDRNRRLTAVVQPIPEEEREFGSRRWRWISGRRYCGILY
jgi:hypothetical protein